MSNPFADLVPPGNKLPAKSKSAGVFSDLIPASQPTVPAVSEDILGPEYKSYPSISEYDLGLASKQAWSPNQNQFVQYLQNEGFEPVGDNLVKAPDGNLYDINSDDFSDIVLRNYPDIAIGLLAGATGGLAGGLASAGRSGLSRLLFRLGAESLTEGAVSAAGEAGRQAVGQGLGVGENFDAGNIAGMGVAGMTAPVISGTAATVGRGLKKGQQMLSGVSDDVVDIVRQDPSIMGRIDADTLEQDQLAFARRLGVDPQDVVKAAAKEKAASLKRSEELGIEIDPSEVSGAFERFQESIAKPLGSSDPLAGMKSDLSSRMGSQKEISFWEATPQERMMAYEGDPILRGTPPKGVTPTEIAATKAEAADMGFKNPMAPSSFREKMGERASGTARVMEDAMLDIEGQIARDRLAKLNKLKEQFPTLKRATNANEEMMLKEQIFMPSREPIMSKSLPDLDDLTSDYNVGTFSPEYDDIIRRRMVQRADRLWPHQTGLSNFGTLAGLGVTGWGASGGPASAAAVAAGVAAQSPKTNLRLNQFLGYLDRTARKGKGAVGKGAASAREAALIQMLEDNE